MSPPTPATDPVRLVLESLDQLSVTGQLASDVDVVRQRLAEPLRIAVAGRLKSGKSTLVNALLGRRIAPTSVGECTKMVTWFHYGMPERVELRLRDGTRQDLQLTPEAMLPSDPGVAFDLVESLHVWLANDALKAFTLIDTPGLASADELTAATTQELLELEAASTSAAAGADALVFVLNAAVRSDEKDVLRAFTNAHGVVGSAVNAVAVLTKVDQLDPTGDFETTAALLAKRLGGRLAEDVSTVVPVVGLWAETARTGRLLERDAEVLREVASLDDPQRAESLRSAEGFKSTEVASPESRQRLLDRLGLRGLTQFVPEVRAGMLGAVDVQARLIEASGYVDVAAEIDGSFGFRSAPLRAWRALSALGRLGYARGTVPSERAQLQSLVERLQRDPALHRVAELEALHECCSGVVDLPDELYAELRDMALNPRDVVLGSEPDVAQAALDASGRWQTFAFGASPAQARIARVMLQSYRIAAQAGSSG